MTKGRIEITTCVGLPEALDKKRGTGFVEFDVRPVATRGSVGRSIEVWCEHVLRNRQECLDGAESLRVAADCLEQIGMTSFRPAVDKPAETPAARTRQPKRPPQPRKQGTKVGRMPAAPKKSKKRVGRPKGSKTKRPPKPRKPRTSKHALDLIDGRTEP